MFCLWVAPKGCANGLVRDRAVSKLDQGVAHPFATFGPSEMSAVAWAGLGSCMGGQIQDQWATRKGGGGAAQEWGQEFDPCRPPPPASPRPSERAIGARAPCMTMRLLRCMCLPLMLLRAC